MNSPALDIQDYLLADEDSAGFGFIKGEDLHVGNEPSEPPNTVTIFDVGGPTDLGLTSSDYERPSIMIRVRNMKYRDGFNLAQRIKVALHGLAQKEIGGTLYTVIMCTNGPAHYDWDDNGRARFIINFSIQRRAV